MNLPFAALVLLAVVGVSVGLMLAVRRRAPAGGFFHDSNRAVGVFGFIGVSFSVLLAFVIFMAFESFSAARTEAAREADAVFQQFEVAQLFQAADRDALQSQLICYARSVVSDEWPRMRSGDRSERVDAWVVAVEDAVAVVAVNNPKQAAALEQFFDETVARKDGRRVRLQEAAGVIPAPMWVVLLLGGACLLGFVLLFADSGERLFVQAALIAVVAISLVAPLVLVEYLDHPYRGETGSIMPTSMQFTLDSMQHERQSTSPVGCTEAGAPDARAGTWQSPSAARPLVSIVPFEEPAVRLDAAA